MPKTVLIVDDKQGVYESLALNFADFGYCALWAADSAGALELLCRNPVAAVLLDLSLGSESGMDLLETVRGRFPGLPVVMITGYGTLELAVRAIKMGAYDFLPKPLHFDRLRHTIEEAIEVFASREDSSAVTGGASGACVSVSPKLRKLYRRAEMLAKTELSVLVTGESGSGKELLVDFIHANSNRAGKMMERINCSSFPETLIDNELFGHDRGAFTGAQDSYAGLFERADGGTLHLDEVADLALPSQAKLLRVLEDGRVRRLGGARNLTVDVRVIASTNKDLPKMIADGRFREDLFYRLNAAYLYIPPLRERHEDLEPLIGQFLSACPDARGKSKRFAPAALAALRSYGWPGNIRELKNVVCACVAVSDSPVIAADDLPQNLVAPSESSSAGERRLESLEREHIIRALEENRFNKKKTSEQLGIDRKTLYNKMKIYGIV